MNSTSQKNTLLIDCNDAKGLIYKITDIIYRNNLNIVLNREFVEHESRHFFMRTVVEGVLDEKKLFNELENILPAEANIRLKTKGNKKIVLMVTKEHHVLSDLLIRNEFGEIKSDVQAVISNHQVLKAIVEKFNIPFHHIAHDGKSRKEHEEQILK